MCEIYAICVKQGIHPQYFLDVMEIYELKAIVKQYEADYQENWNQTRIIAHSIYQSQATKSLDYTDVMKFPWDNDNEDLETSKPQRTAEERQQYALNMQNIMNSK